MKQGKGLQISRKQGEIFSVGERQYTLEKIRSETQFTLRDDIGNVFEVEDKASSAVAAGVTIICGTRGQRDMARIVIDAPKEMRISRD